MIAARGLASARAIARAAGPASGRSSRTSRALHPPPSSSALSSSLASVAADNIAGHRRDNDDRDGRSVPAPSPQTRCYYVPPAYRVHDENEDDQHRHSAYRRSRSPRGGGKSAPSYAPSRGGGRGGGSHHPRRPRKFSRRVRSSFGGGRVSSLQGGRAKRGGGPRPGRGAPSDRRGGGGRGGEYASRRENEGRGSGGGYGARAGGGPSSDLEAAVKILALMEDEAGADGLRRAYRGLLYHGGEPPTASSSDGDGKSLSETIAMPSSEATLADLKRSEEAYRSYGAALRSLAGRWSEVRAHHHGRGQHDGARALTDLLSDNEGFHGRGGRGSSSVEGGHSAMRTPFDRASECLRALEVAREERLDLIAGAVEAEREKMKKVEEGAAGSGGFFGAVASIFGGGSSTDAVADDVSDARADEKEYRALTRGLTAHADRASAADAELCHAVMKSAMHWNNVAERTAWYGGGGGDSSAPGAGGAETTDDTDVGNDDDSAAPSEGRERDRIFRGLSAPARRRKDYAARVASARRSAQILADDLEATLDRMIDASRGGGEEESGGGGKNELLRPTAEVYHTVMEACARAGTVRHATAARRFLRVMRHEGDSGEVSSSLAKDITATVAGSEGVPSTDTGDGADAAAPLRPTPRTYHLVLKAFREAADAIGHERGGAGGVHQRRGGGGGAGGGKPPPTGPRNKDRRRAALQAESLLYEMEREAEKVARANSQAKLAGVPPTVAPSAVVPNAVTYNLVLASLANAGHGAVPDLVERADALAARMMTCHEHDNSIPAGGRRAFLRWLFDYEDGRPRKDGGEPVSQVPHPANCHRLVEIYASSYGYQAQDKARALLRRMEEMRDEQVVGGGGGVAQGPREHGRDAGDWVWEEATTEDKDGGANGDDTGDEVDDAASSDNGEEETEEEDENEEEEDGDEASAKATSSTIRRKRSRAKDGMGRDFPSTLTYNSVVRGILRKAEYARGEGATSNTDSDAATSAAVHLENDAAYVTKLLDRMARREETAPGVTTYNHAVRLWSHSGSARAGEQAEEILGKMEVRDACLRAEARWGRAGLPEGEGKGGRVERRGGGGGSKEGTRPDAQSYQNVLECWAEAAKAGAPGAATRASALLDRMEGQCRPAHLRRLSSSSSSSLSSPAFPAQSMPYAGFDDEAQLDIAALDEAIDGCYNDDHALPNRYVYNAVVAACAATILDADAAPALRAAFGAYNRMIERDIVPSTETYALLLRCCARLLQGTDAQVSDRRAQLSRTVFEAACDAGKVSRRVLSGLREANRAMFDSYRPVPRHSARLRDSQ